MKQYINRGLSFLFACLTLLSTVVSADAAQIDTETVSPLYEAYIRAVCGASISESLELTSDCYYTVNNSQVTRVDITTYVEKRNLLVLWDRVEIGQPNNEWTDICYGAYNSAVHTVQLSSTGTYRVTFVFEIYNGTTLLDTIEQRSNTITC